MNCWKNGRLERTVSLLCAKRSQLKGKCYKRTHFFFLSFNQFLAAEPQVRLKKKKKTGSGSTRLPSERSQRWMSGMTHEPGIIVSSVTDTLNWVSAIWFATYWNIAQLHLQQKNVPLSVVAGGGRPLWRAGLAATRQACPSGPGWGSQTGSSRT